MDQARHAELYARFLHEKIGLLRDAPSKPLPRQILVRVMQDEARHQNTGRGQPT